MGEVPESIRGIDDIADAVEMASRCKCPVIVTLYDEGPVFEKFHHPGCEELERIKRDADTD